MRLEMLRFVFVDGLLAVDGWCAVTCVTMLASCKVGGLATCKRICEKERAWQHDDEKRRMTSLIQPLRGLNQTVSVLSHQKIATSRQISVYAVIG